MPVLIGRDRHGASLDAKLPDLQRETIKCFAGYLGWRHQIERERVAFTLIR